MFRVGQKVVCVDDEFGKYDVPGFKYRVGLDGLKAGEVYTVVDLYVHPLDGFEYVQLAEINRPCDHVIDGIYGRGYVAARFRPVQETGMQMLRECLTPKPIKEVA